MSDELNRLTKKINRLRRELSLLPNLEDRHADHEIEEFQHIVLELEESLILYSYLLKKNVEDSIRKDQVKTEDLASNETKNKNLERANEVMSNLHGLIPSTEKEIEQTDDPNPTIELEKETAEKLEETSNIETESKSVESNPEEELNEIVQEINDSAEKLSSLGERLSKMPIADLKSAFGLNERFYYANELFGGDGEEFVRALNELNHLNSYDDALRMIDSKYTWDKEHEDVISFLEIVERRYI